MAELKHELIRASAGTGKTYQLTNRYLRIFFLTREPEKIIALTFTRKAAGEFFEKIFRRLTEAAESEPAAQRLGTELGLPLTVHDCLGALRLLLGRLHQLQLSTYDSFFSRIVQTFPFELGLAGSPSLLDEDQQLQAIERAQAALSRRTQQEPEFLTNFWHAVKRATMGVEAKSIRDLVTGFIQENHTLYFDAPELRLWGQETEIWSGLSPWRSDEIDWSAAGRALEAELAWSEIAPPQAKFWREFIQDLNTWRPPIELTTRLDYFLNLILKNFDELGSGRAEVQLNRKSFLISAKVGEMLQRIGRAIYWSTVQPKLEATQGIFDLVRLFEEIYHREIRMLGQLTLDDATRLLGGSGAYGGGLANRELRDQLGYRLDGSFDHWLLDEFQDTSRLQWKAIADLIEEVISDPEARRSFFAVGDTKQSLYGWRGSDAALFDELQQRYNADVLRVSPLNQSFRSAAAVLSLANQVFGQPEVMAELFTPGLAKRWSAMWQEHVAAPTLSSVSGYACLLHAPAEDKSNFATVLRLLQELKPIERGLSVAVLTQKNDTADALVEYLRANGGPPSSLAANVRPGADNAVAAGLHSFLTLAAHPQDTLAWQHLRMTPLGASLQKEFRNAAKLSAGLLQIWSELGLRGLVDEWARRCQDILDTDDIFNRGRIDLCRDAAAAAEDRGERDIDLFVRQLSALQLREHDNPGQVAVMTIHKAKGLDWDLVILTDLEGKTLMERRGGLEVHRHADGRIAWVLDMPPATLAQFDPALAQRITLSQEAAAFEKLCVLYVGLTRAKTALYVVTHPAKGESANFQRLLSDTLDASPRPTKIGASEFVCAWESGDPDWIERKTPPPVKSIPQPSLTPIPVDERTVSAHAASLQPSSEKAREIRGDALLAQDRRQRDLGTELHAALSRIEWWEHSAPLPFLKTGSDESAALSEDAQRALEAILADVTARRLFSAPTVATKLWREMPFEILIDRHWISGRFDRVTVSLDASGQVVAAHIIDFKVVGALRDAELFRQQHRGQMATYRQVAARLWKLPATAVKTTLVTITTHGAAEVAVMDVE